MGISEDMIRANILLWKITFFHWIQEFDEKKPLILEMKALFQRVPVAANLLLNTIFFNAFFIFLIGLAGFSRDFKDFALRYMIIPSLLGSAAFYYFRFGPKTFHINKQVLAKWTHNWLLTMSLAVVMWTQATVFYLVVLRFERYLPASLQGSFSFPCSTIETYIRRSVVFFYLTGAFLLATVPLWQKGYSLNMALVGRNATLSAAETAMEIIYSTVQGFCVIQIAGPICILLTGIGMPFHFIHVVVSIIELLLINTAVKYKFCILHEVAHEITPLYSMMHIEHHICKGIYPSCAGGATWEFFIHGLGVGFSQTAFLMPYALFNAIYGGVNIVVHTMWPSKSMAQWHTLHHVVQADMFSLNVPGDYDRKFSKDYQRYHKQLEEISPFFRSEWLSDAVGFACVGATALIFHLVFGLGLFHPNLWKDVIWH